MRTKACPSYHGWYIIFVISWIDHYPASMLSCIGPLHLKEINQNMPWYGQQMTLLVLTNGPKGKLCFCPILQTLYKPVKLQLSPLSSTHFSFLWRPALNRSRGKEVEERQERFQFDSPQTHRTRPIHAVWKCSIRIPNLDISIVKSCCKETLGCCERVEFYKS